MNPSKRLLSGAILSTLVIVLAACSPTTPDSASGMAMTATTSDSNYSDESDSTLDSTSSGVAAITVSALARDAVWDESDAIDILLSGDIAEGDSDSIIVAGSTITVTAGGTYRLAGPLTDGFVIVDTQDDQPVTLVLDGVDITNTTGPAIAVLNAEEATVVLAAGTENSLTDGSTYSAANQEANLNAALFSKEDILIGGEGSLVVEGNFNDGIASTDGLVIDSGTITVDAVDDGIRGKDYLMVEGGTLTVTAGGDGLKSDNEEDTDRGLVAILDGTFTVSAAGDAIAAQTTLSISGGSFDLTTTGGGDITSAKGLKGNGSVVVDGGTFTVTAVDDAVHSNGSIVIDGGDFQLATGDDGIHADETLTINAGTILISQAYEGLESKVITINGGDIELHTSDDGINASDGSGQAGGFAPGDRGGRPGGGGGEAANTELWVYINGGTLLVYADGDALDSNGYFTMTGGTVLAHGPTANNNGALDVNGSFEISGGFLVAAGSAGMAETPDTSSPQAFLSVRFTNTQAAGTVIQVRDSDGNVLLTFEPSKQYQSVVFSSPDLVSGESYDIYTGGSPSGTEWGGLFESSPSTGTLAGNVNAS